MRFDDMVAARKNRDEQIRLVAIDFQRYERRRQLIGMAIAVPLFAMFVLLLWQVLHASTNIGAPATESESVVRANERLLEMIKWTVTTILIGGGALIGLNWYTGEARYNLDRAITEQESINYRLELEASMSVAIGLVKDEMEEIREFMSVIEELNEYADGDD